MMSNVRVALVGSLVAAVSAHPNLSNTTVGAIEYTTEIVTELTTYCPAATTLTHGTNTYTVTEATTLTITDCPCTVTKPVLPTTTPEVVYTTEVVTELTTYCPEATTLTHGNQTYTVTEPTTLTITDCPCTVTKPLSTPPAVPTSPATCPAECSAEYNACRVEPHANMAFCASQYASCLGYNPYVNGTLITPTACSHQPAQPTSATGTGAVPVPVPTGSAGSEQPPAPSAPAASCPEECYTAYNECRTAPNASRPACASDYATCLGYNPFGEDGSLITPTACSVGATGGNTVPVPTATGTPSTTGPIPTGGAQQMAPMGVAALVGFMALL